MNMLLFEVLKCYGDTEYSVTLITGQPEEGFIEGVDKTHTFATEAEARTCFEHLRHLTRLTPYAALQQFNRYNKTVQVDLSKCVGHTKRIRHCLKRPDGTKSTWQAVLSGEHILYEDETHLNLFKTLGAFVSAHYKAEHPTRKGGNGWKECETIIYGEWVKLEVVREVVA